jgi:hypothetical protein
MFPPSIVGGPTVRNDFIYIDHITVSAVRWWERLISHPSGVNLPGGITESNAARLKISQPADEEIE